MSPQPHVAVVIVNYRTPELAMRCVAALRHERAVLPSLTATVVDGGSGDGSAETLGTALGHADYRDWVTFLPLPINGGYGWANNQAMLLLARQENPPEFFYVLNPDAEVCAGAVSHLLNELLIHPRCGAVGSQLLASDGNVTPSAFRFPSPGREFIGAAQFPALGQFLGIPGIVVSSCDNREVDWVTGASVLFRTQTLVETGLFDDGFFLYFEEVELMHRLRARGWTVRHQPTSRVVHFEGASTGVGAAVTNRPLPHYWYESRRRYFELTSGAATLVAANVSSLTGLAIAGLKRILGRPPASKSLRAVDLLRSGFWPDAARPSVPRLGEVPGRPPAWIQQS
jgi:N-acetylglucosaminyl-diphospho-decaprenol L-rhamnosyltransferase